MIQIQIQIQIQPAQGKRSPSEKKPSPTKAKPYKQKGSDNFAPGAIVRSTRVELLEAGMLPEDPFAFLAGYAQWLPGIKVKSSVAGNHATVFVHFHRYLDERQSSLSEWLTLKSSETPEHQESAESHERDFRMANAHRDGTKIPETAHKYTHWALDCLRQFWASSAHERNSDSMVFIDAGEARP